jgi:hypothetical protein
MPINNGKTERNDGKVFVVIMGWEFEKDSMDVDKTL